jgi:hypothetical protein
MRRMMSRSSLLLKVFAVGSVLWMVAACSSANSEPPVDPRTQNPTDIRKQGNTGKVFGDDAFTFGGSSKAKDAGEAGGGIGVNSYLWRASLDTLLFMPVNSADPFGGVIITDWHTPPDGPADERFKMNIYILGRALRADGVRVAVFRQVKSGESWQDAPVAQNVSTKIEDAILTKARQLRNETGGR